MEVFAVTEATPKIYLGKQGENNAVSILFKVNTWCNEYGDGGVFTLNHKRATDTISYPVTTTLTDNGVLWLVNSADNAVVGYGECELRYAIGDVIKKSVTWKTYTSKALAPIGDTPPDPFESWYENIITAGDRAEGFANAAKTYSEAAQTAAEAAAEAKRLSEEYADDALEHRNAAEDFKKAAENARTEAEKAENEAKAAAESAAADRSAAAASAQAAAASKQAALASENAAKAAQAAAEAAQTAAGGYASEAIAAAEDAAEIVSNIIDDTLSVAGKAADAKLTGDEINELKSTLATVESNIYTYVDITPKSFEADVYVWAGAGANIGKIIYSTSAKVATINCSDYEELFIDVPKTTWTNIGLVFYNAQNTAIKGYVYSKLVIPDDVTHASMPFGVPSDAVTVKITVLKSLADFFNVKIKVPKTEIIEENLQTTEEEVEKLKVKANKISQKSYMKDAPIKALFPEFVSDFWCSNYLPNTLTGKQVIFTVSGNAGDEYLDVSNIEPSTISVTDVNRWVGFVLTTDEIEYEVYNAIYSSSESKLQIYPPLSKNVTNGIFASVFYDSGTSYTGLHLTMHGYKAYVYNLYNKNPKHCEIGLYNEAFDSRTADTSPFKKIGSGNLYLSFTTVNQSGERLKRYFRRQYDAQFHSSYTPYDTKNGVYWNVDLNGTSGYLELIFEISAGTTYLPEGQEFYVDVYIDNTLKSQTIYTTTGGRRLCVDYENATTGSLRIYANKWAAINGGNVSIGVAKCVWWINELQYDENAKLFPTGVCVAQEFDSWGIYWNGVTGKTLQSLISNDAGVTVPYENHSLGSQTTAWGLAYWYENVKAYNPAIAITNFALNDKNSTSASGFPATITGPDGKTYNNIITEALYVKNTKKLIDFAISNGIQPIIMRNFQQDYYAYTDAVIKGLSKKYDA